MELTANQIKENWDRFIEIISNEFPTRKTALLQMYNELEERAILAPASSYEFFHNAIPGGYIDHVLRVYDFTLKHYKMWEECGFDFNFDLEELKFAAIHHDLGKLGLPGDGHEHYQPETEKWWRENKGRLYKANPINSRLRTSDSTFYLLNYYNIKYSLNEMIGIRLTDGLYDKSNEYYLITFDLEDKLKNSMSYILQSADMMATRFEFERWLQSKNGIVKKEQKPKKALSIETSTDALDTFNKLFGDLA